MTDRPTWEIECRDLFERPVTVTVLADGGKVVVVGPVGETAMLTIEQVTLLRAALRDAVLGGVDDQQEGQW